MAKLAHAGNGARGRIKAECTLVKPSSMDTLTPSSFALFLAIFDQRLGEFSCFFVMIHTKSRLKKINVRSQNDSCKSYFIAEERSNSKVKLHLPPHSHLSSLSFLSTVWPTPNCHVSGGWRYLREATTWHYYDCPLEMTTLSSIRTLSRRCVLDHFWSRLKGRTKTLRINPFVRRNRKPEHNTIGVNRVQLLPVWCAWATFPTKSGRLSKNRQATFRARAPHHAHGCGTKGRAAFCAQSDHNGTEWMGRGVLASERVKAPWADYQFDSTKVKREGRAQTDAPGVMLPLWWGTGIRYFEFTL